jgi:hypothetical protein
MRLALLGWTGEAPVPTHSRVHSQIIGTSRVVFGGVHILVIFEGFQMGDDLCGLA